MKRDGREPRNGGVPGFSSIDWTAVRRTAVRLRDAARARRDAVRRGSASPAIDAAAPGPAEERPDDAEVPTAAASSELTERLQQAGPDPVEEPGADPLHDLDQRRREAGADHRFPFGRPGTPLGRTHPFLFGFTAALGVITAWILVQAVMSARQTLVMVIVAMFLAVGLNPAVERLQRIGMSRPWAVATVFLGLVLFMAGFVASLVPPLTEQISGFVSDIPNYITQLQNNPKIAEWDRRYQLLERASATLEEQNFQANVASWAVGIGKVAISGIFQTLTILILTLYFLSSLPQMKTFFYRLAPRSRRARVALLGDEILYRIGGYVAGNFIISIIAGLTTYIFLEIIGVPYALALALIVAVTDLIPLIGATIGAVVVSAVGFLTGFGDGVACIIFFLIYQQIENYLVAPKVMKRSVDVQPAVTIIAALVGGALLGVVGALLAIPTAAAISLIVREVIMPRQETL